MSQRVYLTPYEGRRVVTIFVAGAAAAVGVLTPGDAAVAIPVKVGALVAFVAVIWITRAMTRSE
jgi:hypothetical protein